TKNDDQLPARIRSKAFERLFQRIRLVCVVYENRRTVVSSGKFKSTPCAAELLQRRKYLHGFRASCNRQAGRQSGILDLEGANERQPDFIGPAMMRHRHDLREPFDNTVEEPDVIALRADRNDFQAAFLGDVGNLSGITIVDAYHRRAAGRDDISKQTELGGEIALDVWVIVEMIA